MIAIGITAVAVLASMPSIIPTAARKKTAVPFAGSITIKSPTSNEALSKSATAAWTYKPGTSVKSTSRVDFQVSKNGSSWTTLASNVPIRDAQAAWNTAQASDAVYYARVLVRGTTIGSVVSNVYVDNHSPAVAVTSPQESQVLIDNANEGEDPTEDTLSVSLGNTKLQAFAFDSLSGIDDVEWWLDKDEATAQQLNAHGANTTYDFRTPQPGFHKLYAVAYDRAGNSETSKFVTIFTGPGPGALTKLPPDCPADNPAAGTDADPCTAPHDPPTTCPVTNPADGTVIADPCATETPEVPTAPSSCPLENNPDAEHIPNDPCDQDAPDAPTPDPSVVPSPDPVDTPSPEAPDVPCQDPSPTQDDPIPHCTVTT